MAGQARLLGRAWRSPTHYVHRRPPGLRVNIPPSISFLHPQWPWLPEPEAPIEPSFSSIDNNSNYTIPLSSPTPEQAYLENVTKRLLQRPEFVIFHVHFICSCGIQHTTTGPRLSVLIPVGAPKEYIMRLVAKTFKCEPGDTMSYVDEYGNEKLPAYDNLVKPDGSFIRNIWVGVWRGEEQRHFIHRLDKDNKKRGWPVWENPDNWYSEKSGLQVEKVLNEEKQCDCDDCMVEQEINLYRMGVFQAPYFARLIPEPIVGLTHRLAELAEEKRMSEKKTRITTGLPTDRQYASVAANVRKMR